MSFKISWDATQILSQLFRAYTEAKSPWNDGYTAWNCKKDLLRVKYELDYMIDRLPDFGFLEHQYHEEMAKLRTWEILNDKM